MDGFFVAKFRVTKRAKQAKEEDEVENDRLMGEDVVQKDVQFDEDEDKDYIQEAKRRRLKAKGIRVSPRNQP